MYLLVQHLHRQQGKAGVLPKAEVEERPAAANGSTQQVTAVPATRGLFRAFEVMERRPRVHMHAGRPGRKSGWRKTGGCQETAIWEQGQERSWQQLHSAK